MATQDLFHRGGKIVIAQGGEKGRQSSERQARGLPGTPAGLRGDMPGEKGPATCHLSHTEDVEPLTLFIQIGIGFVPADLGFLPEFLGLRDEGLPPDQPNLMFAPANELANR